MSTKIKEIYSDNYLIWKIRTDNFFRKDKKLYVGMSAPLILKAQNNIVDRIIFVIEDKEYNMLVPNLKEIKRKDKEGEFKEVPGWKGQQKLFGDENLIKIYYFAVSIFLKTQKQETFIERTKREAAEGEKKWQKEQEEERNKKQDLSKFPPNIRDLDLD